MNGRLKKSALFIYTLFFLFNGFLSACFGAATDDRFDFGTEIAHLSYKEPGVMKEEGFLEGVVLSYTHKREFFICVEGRLLTGRLDYCSIKTGEMDNVDNLLWETRGLFGRDISADTGIEIIPYIGWGYRFLQDDSQGRVTTTGHLGYLRQANYYYTPVGIKVVADTGNNWHCGLVLEYDHFWWGLQKSFLNRANPSYNDLENDQNEGYGFRSSLLFEHRGAEIDFSCEPYFKYWKIGESESENVILSGGIIGTGYEPKNYSKEFGLRIAVYF